MSGRNCPRAGCVCGEMLGEMSRGNVQGKCPGIFPGDMSGYRMTNLTTLTQSTILPDQSIALTSSLPALIPLLRRFMLNRRTRPSSLQGILFVSLERHLSDQSWSFIAETPTP